jgi:hypothetical protein
MAVWCAFDWPLSALLYLRFSVTRLVAPEAQHAMWIVVLDAHSTIAEPVNQTHRASPRADRRWCDDLLLLAMEDEDTADPCAMSGRLMLGDPSAAAVAELPIAVSYG